MDQELEIEEFDPNIPDKSNGDYFCWLCDSHMNAVSIWDAHIIGKRHLKNVRKARKGKRSRELLEEDDIIFIKEERSSKCKSSSSKDVTQEQPKAPPRVHHKRTQTNEELLDSGIDQKRIIKAIMDMPAEPFLRVVVEKLRGIKVSGYIQETLAAEIAAGAKKTIINIPPNVKKEISNIYASNKVEAGSKTPECQLSQFHCNIAEVPQTFSQKVPNIYVSKLQPGMYTYPPSPLWQTPPATYVTSSVPHQIQEVKHTNFTSPPFPEAQPVLEQNEQTSIVDLEPEPESEISQGSNLSEPESEISQRNNFSSGSMEVTDLRDFLKAKQSASLTANNNSSSAVKGNLPYSSPSTSFDYYSNQYYPAYKRPYQQYYNNHSKLYKWHNNVNTNGYRKP